MCACAAGRFQSPPPTAGDCSRSGRFGTLGRAPRSRRPAVRHHIPWVSILPTHGLSCHKRCAQPTGVSRFRPVQDPTRRQLDDCENGTSRSIRGVHHRIFADGPHGRIPVPPPAESIAAALLSVGDAEPADGLRWLWGLVINLARHAERVIAVATGCAFLGLSLPVLTGFDGNPRIVGVALGVLVVSFLVLFDGALGVATAGGQLSEDRPPVRHSPPSSRRNGGRTTMRPTSSTNTRPTPTNGTAL